MKKKIEFGPIAPQNVLRGLVSSVIFRFSNFQTMKFRPCVQAIKCLAILENVFLCPQDVMDTKIARTDLTNEAAIAASVSTDAIPAYALIAS